MDGADPRVEAVGRYYEAIDAGAYDDLRELLAPAFVHDRPDRTFEGRERFVAFMRDERPDPETTHELTGIYVDATAAPGDGSTGPDGPGALDGFDGLEAPADPGSTGDVLARGTLYRADGTAWFRFVDAFAFDGRAAGAASDTGGTSDSGGDAALAVRRITTFVRESVASG